MPLWAKACRATWRTPFLLHAGASCSMLTDAPEVAQDTAPQQFAFICPSDAALQNHIAVTSGPGSSLHCAKAIVRQHAEACCRLSGGQRVHPSRPSSACTVQRTRTLCCVHCMGNLDCA